jgi:hypothetical protein
MKTLKLLVAGVGILSLAQSLPAADRPPRDLKLVGDHWTAWDPPTDIPEGSEVHIIVAGDTLWDLAKKYSGDPYLWPQLWEKNRYILDAHWIYPGDPLVLSVAVAGGVPVGDLDGAVDLDGTGSGADAGAADDDGLKLARDLEGPQPLGTEDDIYCSGFIGADEQSFERSIVGSEYDNEHPTLESGRGLFAEGHSTRIDLTTGDIVYVDGGRAAGLVPGSLHTVMEDGGAVRHPDTGDTLGRLWNYRGRLRMLTVQDDLAIAEVVQACGPIRVGDRLKPFEAEPVPLGRRTTPRPPNYPASGEQVEQAPMIVLSRDRIVSLGQDHVVWLDTGANQDVAPGDIFTIHRPGRSGQPPLVLGEVAVLSVQPSTALAKIISSRSTIFIGDRVVRK